VPRGYKALTKADIGRLKSKPRAVLPPQEPGVRPSNPLPYQLRAAGGLNAAGDAFTVRLEARKDQFGEAAAGAPFLAYADTTAGLAVRNYAAAAGGTLEDSWPLTLFGKIYSVRIHGPNGFFREFQGTPRDPVRMIALIETVTGGRVTGDLEIDASDLVGMTVEDLSYPMNRVRRNGDRWVVESSRSGGWYDVRISRPDPFFSHRFAGRVETGRMSTSDPAMA
jgi:phospholipase C